MPTDGPRNFNDVLPQGGFSGLFKTMGLPTELKVSYFIWVISGLLGLLFGLIGLFAIIAAFAFMPGVAALLLVLLIISLAVAAAQIVLAMKMKEGKEWARLALTILAAVSLLLAIFGSINAGGPGAGPGWQLVWFPGQRSGRCADVAAELAAVVQGSKGRRLTCLKYRRRALIQAALTGAQGRGGPLDHRGLHHEGVRHRDDFI
ncbi:hypothetical protein StoSoilB13_21040 [Arthrobacter sp. StoSoilB13]|nr:hypothetical protein StoSoilB13_21040 [Arthrobacter sp. StoSoilB13]